MDRYFDAYDKRADEFDAEEYAEWLAEVEREEMEIRGTKHNEGASA